MNLIILDLVQADLSKIDNAIFKKSNTKILALSPLSFFFLEKNSIDFVTFHTIVSQEKFRDEILESYKRLSLEENILDGFYLEVSQQLNRVIYSRYIQNFIKSNIYNDITYITDREIVDKFELSNNQSWLYRQLNFRFITFIPKIDNQNIKGYKDYSIIKIFNKFRNKILKKNLKYDWLNMIDKLSVKNSKINLKNIKFTYKIDGIDFKFLINKECIVNSYNTFLTKENYFHLLEYKKTNRLYFFQHGSYLYQNLFIKYNEIKLADINFVFNDYTKKLFENLGAKKVYSVGSILFNQKIRDKKKKYDFLYITQGHDYTGNLQYVDFQNSLHSFDGYNLYQKHKSIIKLFGEKFKDKKIIIRVHPTVVTNGVYVPFWELSELYPNILIDVSIPIHNLIEESKYIISDYFTTEFINRELHYKKNIILFKGEPTPLPQETINDMEKMFILVDSIDDLSDKIRNIEEITKNRKRYDDIIEYYSSKKCDTKKVVMEILEKELRWKIA